MSSKKTKSQVAPRIRRRNTILLFAAIVVLVCVALFTPVFNITDITVTGNTVLTDKEVITASGIKKGSNLFLINKSKAEEMVASLGYVEDVDVKRKFFSRVEIEIKESVEVAYIAFSGNYVGLGTDGRVLSITKSKDMRPKKAVISGFKVKNVKKGKQIEGKNEEKTPIITELLTVLNDNSILSNTKKIDISDLENLYLVLTSDTTVVLGDSYQLDYKLKCLNAVLKELGEIRGGKINVSDPSNVIYEGGN